MILGSSYRSADFHPSLTIIVRVHCICFSSLLTPYTDLAGLPHTQHEPGCFLIGSVHHYNAHNDRTCDSITSLIHGALDARRPPKPEAMWVRDESPFQHVAPRRPGVQLDITPVAIVA